MSAVVRTPDLGRSVADYTGVLGFECQQIVPGVVALVAHGSLQLQLWACGATPGRWERRGPGEGVFEPCHVSVPVTRIHTLYASLRRSVTREIRTDLGGRHCVHGNRLCACGPQPQAWGAWEFAFRDLDGNMIHCVDWMLPGATGAQHPKQATDPSANGGGS